MSHKCGIAKLPNEIMFEITLLVCLPAIYPLCHLGHDASYGGTVDSKALSPLKLATVCRSWKDLVFSNRNLWTGFSIHVKSPNLPRINRHIELSGATIPLSIRLFANSDDNVTHRDARDGLSKVMAVIDANLHRIAYLCLELPEIYFTAFAYGSQRILPDSAPILDEFHIHNQGPETSFFELFKLCSSLPRPRRAFIAGIVTSTVHLDWSHISHLTLGFRDAFYGSRSQEVIDILSMATSLVEFTSMMPTTKYRHRLGLEPITLNLVRKVSLHQDEDGLSSSYLVFANTTMPWLESLLVHDLDFSHNVQRAFLGFLQRSASPLTSVELSFVNEPSGDDLISVFEHTPMVQQLTLGFNSTKGDILIELLLKRLSQWTASHVANAPLDILLPHLEQFHYKCHVLGVPLSAFLGIIENRQQVSGWVQNQELAIQITLGSSTMNPIDNKSDLHRILALRKAKKSFSVSLSDDSRFDFIEEAMKQHFAEENLTATDSSHG